MPATTKQSAGIFFLVAFALLIAANAQPLLAWVRLWAFGGLDYGFVVLGGSLWLLWRCLPELRRIDFRPDWRGLLLMAPLCLGMFFAYLVDVRLAQMTLFILSIGALVWGLLGLAALRSVAGPIVFLFLALPIWNYFRPVLQEMTVRATAIALQMTGIPAFVDETYIQIPRGAILVLSECSGAQYFQAGVTIGMFYAYLNFRSFGARALVLAGFALMGIVGNWIRVYALIFMGHMSETRHFFVGWGIFTLLAALAFWLSLRLQRYEDKKFDTGVRRTTGGAPVAGGPVTVSRGWNLIAAVLAVALVVAGPAAAHWVAKPAMELSQPSSPIPVHAPWSGPFAADTGWRPSFHGASTESLASYREGGRSVTVYLGDYPLQNQEAEVINELNKVYTPPWGPRGGYAGTDYTQVKFAAGAGSIALTVVETRLGQSGADAQRLVWHWYRIAGRNVVRPWQAKLAELSGLLRGRHDAMAIVLSTDAGDLESARATLRDFVAANAGALQTAAAE